MSAPTPALRQALLACAQELAAEGLNKGTSGNVSVRVGTALDDGLLITPTGMPPLQQEAADMVWLDAAGAVLPQADIRPRKPSSEWQIHRDIYVARPEFGAVIHTHSPFATAIACLRREIPPFHYMIARFGGDTVRCADYATFGTAELSHAALAALDGRNACLLANHGMLACGRDLAQALAHAVELETLCEQYWRACQLGQPVLLDAQEMQRMQEKFQTYGQPG
jgi:L-fuculose-phosphate aldolase